jgi:hypothetical protein
VLQQPVTPVVQLPEGPTTEVGVADVLIGSFGIVGAAIVALLIAGPAVGLLFIAIRRWRERRFDEGSGEAPVTLDLSSPASTPASDRQ